jgi:hypothetical protein
MDYYQVSVSDWIVSGENVEIVFNKIMSESVKRFPDGSYNIELENAVSEPDLFDKLKEKEYSVKREYKVYSPEGIGDEYCKSMEEKFFGAKIVATKHQSSVNEVATYYVYITNKEQ